MNKRSFYLLVLFCGALILIFLYLLFKFIASTPTNVPSGLGEIYRDEGEGFEKGEEISRLIDKLPYIGTFFSLAYDFDTALFYVYINPDNESGGNREFNEFLKQNGI